jgi:hypothetical protein
MPAKKRANSKQSAKRVAKRRTSAAAGRDSQSTQRRARDVQRLRSKLESMERSLAGLRDRLDRLEDWDGRTALQVLQDIGLIGCIKDGPSDLSTNPKHMEGFGES